MNRLTFIFFLSLVLFQCSNKDSYDPANYFKLEKQNEIVYKSIRYSAKLPPRCNHEIKFDSIFDDYYKNVAADYTMLKLHRQKDGAYDFLISRPARSITPMFEGIGGQFKLDDKDSLIVYNETFRTWKMPYADLLERGTFLFDRMVKGEDLTIFYSKNAGDKYIEFPDDRFTFDKVNRRWHDSAFDTLETN
jgi:hypothetical protein